jgi:hypothetical protein
MNAGALGRTTDGAGRRSPAQAPGFVELEPRAELDGRSHADLDSATALLQQAAVTVDRLWKESRTTPGAPAIGLGDASHCIHRALIALHDRATS